MQLDGIDGCMKGRKERKEKEKNRKENKKIAGLLKLKDKVINKVGNGYGKLIFG